MSAPEGMVTVRRRNRSGPVPASLFRRCREARDLYDDGRFGPAEVQLRVLLSDYEQTIGGGDHPETIALRNLLGSTLFQLRNLAGSAEFHREAMYRAIRVLGRNDRRTLSYAHNLGAALVVMRLPEGIAILEDTLRRRTRKLGKYDEDTLTTANTLGATLIVAGSAGRGIDLLRRAYDASARKLGPGHPLHREISKNLDIALRNLR